MQLQRKTIAIAIVSILMAIPTTTAGTVSCDSSNVCINQTGYDLNASNATRLAVSSRTADDMIDVYNGGYSGRHTASPSKNPNMVSVLAELVDLHNRATPSEVQCFYETRQIMIVDYKVQVVLVMAEGARSPDRYGNIEIQARYKNLVQVLVPISELESLADDQAIHYIRLPLRAHPAVVSEGAEVINATSLHAIGVDGTGAKVAVIDAGFYGYGTSSEIWNVIEAKSFRGDGDITGGGEKHGTACAEVVLDVAPDASLYLYNFNTGVEFGEAVDRSISQGVDIISCSMGWANAGPYDGTGDICDIANNASANGILFVNSAGNQAEKHYEGTYTDTLGDDWHEFQSGVVDEILDLGTISAGYPITLFLSWDDWGVVDQDYDLYLYEWDGSIWVMVDGSDNTQNGGAGQEPTEAIYYTSTGGYYGVAISNYDSRGDAHFELYSFNNNFPEYNVESSSLTIPADAVGVMTAGATYWGDDSRESFSSQGPTNDGRTKPDVTAPDGVTNSFYQTGFYGTSASCPHTAGAAALLLSADTSLNNTELQYHLESTAKDLDSPGKDNRTGSGRIDVYAAYQEMKGNTTANWTFIVYLDGDNNLEGAGIDDVNEMEVVGSTQNVNIVVQFDRIPGHDSSNGDWTDTRRYYVTKDNDTSNITSTLVEDMGEVDMADPAMLSDFTVWAITKYPAEHYALILWNHGSGWKYAGELVDPFKGIIYDDTSGNGLSMQELKQALSDAKNETGKTIDLLGFDACLMQMVEVAYQVRDYSDVVVGSEEYEQGDGWPYNTVLANLTNNPTISATDLGSEIVIDYLAFCGSGSDQTQSAADQTKLTGLIAAVDSFAEALNGSLSSNCNAIMNARSQSESYYDPDFIDLYDFAERINSSISNSTVRSAAINVMENVSDTIIEDAHGSGNPDSHGFSIYFPETKASYTSQSSAYRTIDFAVDTAWDEFLSGFYNAYESSTVIPGAEILLVDDDMGTGASCELYYRNALYANGYNYSYWNVADDGSPNTTILSSHQVAVWLTGNDYETTLTSVDQSNLATYLNSGGKLFISGQDIGYDIGNDSFYHDYLHANYLLDGAGIYTLAGTSGDPIGDGLTIGISGGDGANQYHPSEIVPNGTDTSMVFNYTGSGCGAIKADMDTYRVVYFAFGFEAINSTSDRNTVMDRVITWFGLSPTRTPGDVNGDGVVNIGDAVLLFNWVSFPNEQGTTYVLNMPANANVNGDTATNIGDAVLLFNWVSFPNERGTTYILQ